MPLNIGPAPLVQAFRPTLAADNDLQLLEVETLPGDGAFGPTGRLRAKTAGTPGPLWNTAAGIPRWSETLS